MTVSHDEAERLATLRRYAILDTEKEAAFDRIVRLASKLFDVPIALVTLVDSDRQWYKASCGIDIAETARESGFASRTMMHDDVFVLLDATKHELFYDHPLVTGDLSVRFYAGAPLVAPNGHKLGSLCLVDKTAREEFSERDQAVLADLASLVVEQIEMRRAAGNVLNEIEDRAAAQDTLATVEHRLGLFFEHAPISVAMLDVDFQYLGVSQRWREMFGLGDAIIEGQSHFSLLPHLAEPWMAECKRCLAGEVINIDEERIATIEGEAHWIERQMRPWFSPDGHLGGIIVSVTVIDERVEAAAATKRNASFLQTVLDTMNDGIVACDADGTLSLFNEATRRFHGVDKEENVPPEQWSQYYDLYEPDAVTPLVKERIPLFRAWNGENVGRQEMVIIPKGQVPRHMICNATPLYDLQGEKIGAVATMQDITLEREMAERWREAETRYEAIFNSTFQFCGLLDLDGTLLEANDRVVEFSGQSRDDLIGEPIWDCLWWDVEDEARLQLERAVSRARQGAFVRYEWDVTGGSDRQITIDFSLSPVRDDSGAITYLVAEGRDITNLRKTEDLLALVIDNLPFAVTYIDAGFKLRMLNETYAAWQGTPGDELVGRDLREVTFSRDYDNEMLPRIQRVLAGESLTYEGVADLGEQRGRIVNCSYVPDIGPDGRVRGCIAIASDVTAQRAASEALRRHKQELELILNNVPIIIFFKDEHNKIVRLNEAAARSMNMTVEEVEGKNTYDLFPEMAEAYHLDDLDVLESGVPRYGIVERYTPLDGEEGWVRTDKVPYTDPDTGTRFIFAAAIDITAEKRASDALVASEEDLSRRYNNTPAMMHSLSEDGTLLAVSDFWLEKLGYERSEVIGHKVTEFFSDESRERAEGGLLAHKFATGSGTDIEYQMIAKSGEPIDVLLSAIIEEDQETGVRTSLEVMTDITDRKSVERKFIQAQKMETVGQLTGGLAHDFNNLLGVIIGNLQLIQRSSDGDGKLERRIRAAIDASNRGAELTRRLLAFSRRQTLETEVVDLRTMILDFSDMLSRAVGEAVALRCAIPEDLPLVRTDPAQLQSALLNLAVNARDAMTDGGMLSVEAHTQIVDDERAMRESTLKPGRYVVVSVTDTGDGIEGENLEKIFEPFFTTKETGKGSGLGLSMVYGFIRQTGGHIQVESKVGIGTSFKLYLPAGDETKVTVCDCPNVELAAFPEGGKVLVVEDQAAVRAVAVGMLHEMGLETTEAENGPAALELLTNDPDIELLFTDIIMPGGMDGMALAKAARALRPDLLVVFATGYADSEILNRRGTEWRKNLVVKPYTMDGLAGAIRNAVTEAKRSGKKHAVRAGENA